MKRHLQQATFGVLGAVMLLAGLSLAPALRAQQAAQNSSLNDKWLHVRVESTDGRGDTVRVNVPLALAAKVLESVDHDQLHHGHINVNRGDFDGVDLRTILNAVKSTSDGEFVTVQKRDANVSVAKKGGFLLVHVVDKESHGENVDVKMPMSVADALVAPGNQDLDLVGAIRALAAAGDTELVNVKDRENTVRVWLDSKNNGD
jgi:hypothetical protein